MCYYRTDDGKCNKYSDDTHTSYCVDGPCPDDMPTNADRIRGMGDEELAEFLQKVKCRGAAAEACDAFWEDTSFEIDWLQQPYKEDSK